MLTLANTVANFFRGSRQLPINDDAEDQRRKVIGGLVSDGFTAWAYSPPPRTILVECVRASTGENFEVIPADMRPEFNVHGLYWRPARQMKTIDAR